MTNGDHTVQLAALRAEIDRALTPRLDRIERKVDALGESHYGLREEHSGLKGRVAGWSAGVAGAVSIGVVVAGRFI